MPTVWLNKSFFFNIWQLILLGTNVYVFGFNAVNYEYVFSKEKVAGIKGYSSIFDPFLVPKSKAVLVTSIY